MISVYWDKSKIILIRDIIESQIERVDLPDGRYRIRVHADKIIFSIGFNDDGFTYFVSDDGIADDNDQEFCCRIKGYNSIVQDVADFIMRRDYFKLRVLIAYWEHECSLNKTQHVETKMVFGEIKNLLENHRLEHCSAILDVLGSKRYKVDDDEYSWAYRKVKKAFPYMMG